MWFIKKFKHPLHEVNDLGLIPYGRRAKFFNYVLVLKHEGQYYFSGIYLDYLTCKQALANKRIERSRMFLDIERGCEYRRMHPKYVECLMKEMPSDAAGVAVPLSRE